MSFTVCETITSPACAFPATRDPMWTVTPRSFSPDDLALARMDADPDLDPDLADGLLHGVRASDRGRGRGERREEPVTGGIDLAASEATKLRAQPQSRALEGDRTMLDHRALRPAPWNPPRR